VPMWLSLLALFVSFRNAFAVVPTTQLCGEFLNQNGGVGSERNAVWWLNPEGHVDVDPSVKADVICEVRSKCLS
jgi:hypothetical protein